jgi:DNA-binding transcriptional regulator YdaS (Cro superfamily)
MPANGLILALKAFDGNQTRMAEATGMSQQLISYRVRRNLPLPAEYVLPTERETGISRHDLRPDLYPREGAAA